MSTKNTQVSKPKKKKRSTINGKKKQQQGVLNKPDIR